MTFTPEFNFVRNSILAGGFLLDEKVVFFSKKEISKLFLVGTFS